MKSPERIAEQRQWREAREARFQDHPEEKAALFLPYVAAAKARMQGAETPDEITRLLTLVGCPHWLRKPARKAILSSQEMRESAPRMRRPSDYLPPPTVINHDPYRSTYERRLAAAFDRLSIRYRYESARFPYQDNRGHQHTYTPDFVLVDMHQTFVEVKGVQGARSTDNVKMWLVLKQHAITLLLWDAAIIDMVEDMQSAREVEGLLRATRLTP